MKEDELNYCKKHHHRYVTECVDCYREQSACIHGVPFDSECGECEEDAMLVKAGKERSFKHPLKNPNSRYYELWEDVETIDIIESMLTAEELIGACKFNILKYQLRLGKKDDVEKERVKIKSYQDYLRYLDDIK